MLQECRTCQPARQRGQLLAQPMVGPAAQLHGGERVCSAVSTVSFCKTGTAGSLNQQSTELALGVGGSNTVPVGVVSGRYLYSWWAHSGSDAAMAITTVLPLRRLEGTTCQDDVWLEAFGSRSNNLFPCLPHHSLVCAGCVCMYTNCQRSTWQVINCHQKQHAVKANREVEG